MKDHREKHRSTPTLPPPHSAPRRTNTSSTLRLLHRVARVLDLCPDRQLLGRLASLLLRGDVGVHDDGQEHVEQDKQHHELERHHPDRRVVVVDQLHIVNLELPHEDSPTHEHRLVLVLEALDGLTEDDIRGGGEAEENRGEDDEEVDDLHGRLGQRADDNVQPRIRLERLELRGAWLRRGRCRRKEHQATEVPFPQILQVTHGQPGETGIDPYAPKKPPPGGLHRVNVAVEASRAHPCPCDMFATVLYDIRDAASRAGYVPAVRLLAHRHLWPDPQQLREPHGGHHLEW